MKLSEVKATISGWTHDDAKEAVVAVVKKYGLPHMINRRCALWYDVGQFDRVYVKDEIIPHEFPKPHRDMVYAWKKVHVMPDAAAIVPYVTGSIFIDLLKQEAGARCGDMIANAISLQFVHDLSEGVIPLEKEKARAEYAKRIKSGKTPDWFEK